jgi:hypothetical protein
MSSKSLLGQSLNKFWSYYAAAFGQRQPPARRRQCRGSFASECSLASKHGKGLLDVPKASLRTELRLQQFLDHFVCDRFAATARQHANSIAQWQVGNDQRFIKRLSGEIGNDLAIVASSREQSISTVANMSSSMSKVARMHLMLLHLMPWRNPEPLTTEPT